MSGADLARARVRQLIDLTRRLADRLSAETQAFEERRPRDIADALTKAGTPVEKSEVVMGEGAFRTVGEFEVVVHLHADVETTVKVVVEPEAA